MSSFLGLGERIGPVKLYFLSSFLSLIAPLALTLIDLGLVCGDLGMVKVRMPFSKPAFALSVSNPLGRVTERLKVPYSKLIKFC